MQRSEIWVIGRNLLLTTSHHIVGTEIEKLTQISEEEIEFPEKTRFSSLKNAAKSVRTAKLSVMLVNFGRER